MAEEQSLRALDALEILALVRRELAVNAELHEVRVAGNGVQWCAQLMTHVRQEVGFHAVRLLGSTLRFLGEVGLLGKVVVRAAHLGHDKVVRILIKAGAPLDHVNNLHWTALIESIVLGNGGPRHVATLKALVDAGASLKLTDRGGNTPLALAKGRGYAQMVAILEQAGAR